jgi:hypothetical protein
MIKKVKTYVKDTTDSGVITDYFDAAIMQGVTAYTFNGLGIDGNYVTEPAWFIPFGSFPFSLGWYINLDVADIGFYSFSYTLSYGATDVEYIVELNLEAYNQIDLPTNCNTKLLAWLTRQGGWAVFPFNGNTTFETEIPDAETYQTPQYLTAVSERRGVTDSEILTTGDIPQEALAYMESLKQTTQAYIANFLQDGTVEIVPVLIEAGTFTKRNTNDKFFDVSVRIIYATEITMQNG